MSYMLIYYVGCTVHKIELKCLMIWDKANKKVIDFVIVIVYMKRVYLLHLMYFHHLYIMHITECNYGMCLKKWLCFCHPL